MIQFDASTLLLAFSGLLLLTLITIQIALRQRGITAQRQFEQHKTEYLALSAHYFLTPLSVIKGTIAELLDPSAPINSVSERQRHYSVIQANTNRLLLMVQNITTATSIDALQLKANFAPVDVLGRIEDCIADVHALATQKNITIHFHRPESGTIDQIDADGEKIHQAIGNILDNAVKFTPAGGHIEVTCERTTTHYVIKIADSGVGIDASELSKLFTRFHRGTDYLNLDYEGMGLGLYIAKYLLEANRGGLAIESKKGQGTLATISLRLS